MCYILQGIAPRPHAGKIFGLPYPTCTVSTFIAIIMLISVAKRERVSVAKRESAYASSMIVKAAALAACRRYRQLRERRLGRSPRERIRRTVEEIYQCLGPVYFRRAYRMTYESFLKLHEKVAPKIIEAFQQQRRYHRKGGRKGSKGGYYKLPPIHNGAISTSVRLALALRYFAGGSPYDLMAKYGVSHTSVFDSVWIVVEAIKNVSDFDIEYPSSHDEQRRIAKEFKQKSQAEFDNCAGAIDGILIWTHKPSEKDCIRSKVDHKKFMCGRKNKFGLNCQAVCDVRGRFLDISITYGGSSSDCLAFENSNLYKRLMDGILLDGLVIFGDNAYLNSSFMATPYPNVAARATEMHKSQDSYNFYHSQVSRIVPR